MKIQNITSYQQYFFLDDPRNSGFERGLNIAASATVSVPDNDFTLASALQMEAAGIIAIIEGPSQVVQVSPASSGAYAYVETTGATSNGDTVTVAGVVFELNTSAGACTAGHLWAGVSGAGAASLTLLAAAINAAGVGSAMGSAGVVAGTELTVSSKAYLPLIAGSPDNTNLTLTKSGTNLAVSGATFTVGTYGRTRKAVFQHYAVVAGDVTAKYIVIPTGATLTAFVVQYYRAGALYAFDGSAVVNGNAVTINDNGSNNLASGDVISIVGIGS